VVSKEGGEVGPANQFIGAKVKSSDNIHVI